MIGGSLAGPIQEAAPQSARRLCGARTGCGLSAMATDEPRAFGELRRRYWLPAGLTQEALAEQAGLSVRGLVRRRRLRRGLRVRR